ncbi:MAG: phage baseplate assembly protein V [Clostridiales bacterium]|nr:phage baseplate assembly protein V [Clostridiales bacterium]
MNKQYLMNAKVIDTNDPEKLGRVRLLLPGFSGEYEDQNLWARVLVPMAGKDRGQCLLPEIEDEVLVAFTPGNLSDAYVLGGLFSPKNPPPEKLGGEGNDLKLIKTRSGHTLLFNDHEGEEQITLTDKNDNSLIIKTGDDSITIKAKSKIEIITEGELTLSGKKINLTASDTIEIKADSSLVLDGGNTADLKASTVNIN